MKDSTFYVKRYHTDFVGTIKCVDYVGPYGENQDYVLNAQYQHDMNRAKPDVTQPTYYEWVEVDCDTKDETVISSVGYRTRSFFK
jgi:hypothetical protein